MTWSGGPKIVRDQGNGRKIALIDRARGDFSDYSEVSKAFSVQYFTCGFCG
jgi:hypothetical protein